MLWCRCGKFDNNIGWLPYNFGLETFFGICGILDSAKKTIRIDYRITALNDGTITDLLAVLVVGEFVILDIETELVGRVLLKYNEKKKLNQYQFEKSRVKIVLVYTRVIGRNLRLIPIPTMLLIN